MTASIPASKAAPTRKPGADAAAADWLARRHAGLSADETAAFDAWRMADAEHAAAFARLERVWSHLNAPRCSGRASAVLLELDRRDKLRKRCRRTAMVSLAGVGAAAALYLLAPIRAISEPPTRSTVAVRPNVQTLADGSKVELDSRAEIDVTFTPEERRVQLLRGEALFAVMPDATRPFLVIAGDVAVRAVGTAFSVRHGAAGIDVLVTEGKVTIARLVPPAVDSNAPAPAAPVLVPAGSRALMPSGIDSAGVPALGSVTPAEMSAALAWRDKRVEFSGTPLREAVEIFNRHNRLQLSVADSRTGARKITGIFWSDDPRGFTRVLQLGLDLEVSPAADHIVLREP